MELRPHEVKALNLRDFNLLHIGYCRRQEKEWDRARSIMAFVLNYGGMRTKTFVKPQDIRPLALDKEDDKRPITTLYQAKMLFKEFE